MHTSMVLITLTARKLLIDRKKGTYRKGERETRFFLQTCSQRPSVRLCIDREFAEELVSRRTRARMEWERVYGPFPDDPSEYRVLGGIGGFPAGQLMREMDEQDEAIRKRIVENGWVEDCRWCSGKGANVVGDFYPRRWEWCEFCGGTGVSASHPESSV